MEITKLLKKTVQINLGHMNINRYLPFCLVFVRTVKRTANLPTLTGSLLQGQECQEYYRIQRWQPATGWTGWIPARPQAILLTKLPFRDGLKLPYVSYYE